MSQRVLQALDRRAGSMRSGRDHNLRAANDLVVDGDPVWVEETSGADNEVSSLLGQFRRFGIPAAVDDALRAVDRGRPVNACVAGDDPEVAEALG